MKLLRFIGLMLTALAAIALGWAWVVILWAVMQPPTT